VRVRVWVRMCMGVCMCVLMRHAQYSCVFTDCCESVISGSTKLRLEKIAEM